MRCAVFARAANGKFMVDLLKYAKIQVGVELTAYFELIENSETKIYKFHHDVNQVHKELYFEEVSEIELDSKIFDKLYIVGADFDLRQQFLDAGVDYKKISMCYGDIHICCCPLDDIFVMHKDEPQVPFKKEPAKIYPLGYESETAKAHDRRVREGFFDKYTNRGGGLDIGYGGDPVIPNCCGWDFKNGDAQYLAGIEDETFDFVYSSHCLEHMYDVRIALKNWFRVVKRGGYLLLAIPHRDLYEKKTQLPSRWNFDHKHMFLIGKSEPPDTLDIVEEIKNSLDDFDIKYIKACDEGHTITDPLVHSDGEYQIEIVIQKL